MLFVSSQGANARGSWLCGSFNLGIEMLFVSSKGAFTVAKVETYEFQSRNRDAFRFKETACQCRLTHRSYGFNLGIEMLFVSSLRWKNWAEPIGYSFNLGIEMLFVSSLLRQRTSEMGGGCFNLGIEMLFVSSPADPNDTFIYDPVSFNLGIEMLFVSSV